MLKDRLRYEDGSSPLTRGKRSEDEAGTHTTRLIPAHAGKTKAPLGRCMAPPAHPRSRGENAASERRARAWKGSSPLTRGKPLTSAHCLAVRRLIPAHAGKTACAACRGTVPEGSSPLTRGKPCRAVLDRYDAGLIPAHAGKTILACHWCSLAWAHPRSRGENYFCRPMSHDNEGSSPLTRGKRGLVGVLAARPRLIPAHAGKTWRLPCGRPASGAHPRSRGENPIPG